jgi:RIP metalloprotease RseP
VWRIFLVAAGFGITILIHELGHFIVAKRIGVGVERFSIGFGPKLFGFKKGETEYRLSVLPLGGYVKMLGEHPEEAKTGNPKEFYSRTPLERIAIVFAGGVTMALFAIVLFVLAFSFGVSFPSAEIGAVMPGGAAWEAGLTAGDEVIAINGNKDVDFEDLTIEAALTDEPLELLIRRGDETFTASVMPELDPSRGLRTIGVTAASSMTAERIAKGSPADKGGLEPGDRIVRIDGFTMDSWQDMQKVVAANPGRPLTFDVMRDGKTVQLTIVPERYVTYGLGLERKNNTRIGSVITGSPADKAGIERGMSILKVDGLEVASWQDLIKAMVGTYGERHTFTVKKADGGIEELHIVPEAEDRRYGQRVYEKAGIALLTDDMRIAVLAAGSVAAESALEVGDRILRVDGNPFSSPEAFDRSMKWGKKEQFTFTVEREGRELSIPVKIPAEVVEKRGVIGIVKDEDAVIGGVAAGSPAEEAGLRAGDRIVSLNGARVGSLQDVRLVAPAEGTVGPMKIVYEREGVTYEKRIQPVALEGSAEGKIGILPGRKMVLRKYPFLKACAFGLHKSWMIVKLVYLTIQKLFIGRLSPKTLAGPIAIVAISYEVAGYGITQLIYFLGIININLAVVNLLPIPILDGGMIAFFIIEKIKGKPVSKRIMELAQYVGLAIIVTLFIYVMYLDINRLLGS